MSRPDRLFAGLAGAILVALAGCKSEPNPFDPGGSDPGTPPPSTTSVAVASTSPAANATDVSVNAMITASFNLSMDAASFGSGSMTVSGGVSGALSVSGSTVTFDPSGPLAAGTQYTVTIKGTVESQSGKALGSDYSWSFTTAAPPLGLTVMPLSAGKQWRYLKNDTSSVSAVSSGTSNTYFEGERFVRAVNELTYQGRQAWRLMYYDYNTRPSTFSPPFRVTEHFVSAGTDGLFLWNGTWKRMLGSTSSFSGGTFFMANGPSRGPDLITLSNASTVVPAGSFSTVRTRHFSEEFDQNAPVHWTDVSTEDWASGTGLVRAAWNLYINDRDPMAADFSLHGNIVLTHVDVGPFPAFPDEVEPNDNQAGAMDPGSSAWVVEGHTAVADAGVILTDGEVGCTGCLFGNVNGVRLFQDWYRMTVSISAPSVALALAYDPGSSNDLDLYVFRELPQTGALSYVASSTSEKGIVEILSGTLTPGVYHVVVQAWATSGNVRYWLSRR